MSTLDPIDEIIVKNPTQQRNLLTKRQSNSKFASSDYDKPRKSEQPRYRASGQFSIHAS